MTRQLQVPEETLRFWKQELDGAVPGHSLPKDRKGIDDGPPQVEHWDAPIDADLGLDLRRVAGKAGVTLPELLLAAFQVFLFRYTDQHDLLVGCHPGKPGGIEAHRTASDGDAVVPVRIRICEDESFVDLLRRVHTALVQIRRHGELPVSVLREILPSNGTGDEALSLPVRFAVDPGGDSAWDPANIGPRTSSALPPSDLSLIICTGEAGFRLRFHYDTRRYQPATTQWMSRHYRQLLAGIARNPLTPPADLEMATLEEQTLVREWGRGKPGTGQDNLRHERFQAHVDQRPDALAVVHGGGQLTYRELDRRANQVAHHLQALGVGPDVIVAVCMEPSPELVIASIAVYKAGGGLLFLDPAAPQARLSVLLDMAAPAVLLTKKPFCEKLRDARAQRVYLDDEDRVFADRPDTPPDNHAAGHNVAALLVTSGSTGRPKIVVEPYGQIRGESRSDTTDRHILKSSAGTTFTSSEVLVITRGGTLFIAPEAVQSDMQSLVSFIGRYGITYLLVAPSTLETLLTLDDLAPCQSLRTVFCIGEMIKPDLKRRFFERLEARLLVGYGCTEARGATSRWCAPDDDPGIVDAGHTNPTMEVFVLDAKRRPTPVGIPGEVYVGGQIAKGYLNDPVATAERFIPHPFSQTREARLFRTGDRARWLPTGDLEILDRLDRQVKIRGFRVELGEIEAALGALPAVARAAVVARDDGPGGRQLVGYVVAAPGMLLETAELGRELGEQLPDYMVPGAFVQLEELPLTRNGKLDRRALPAPERQRAGYRAPRTPGEQMLCGILAEVLSLERVGIDENFFALGGDSLVAARVVSRVRRSLGVELAISTLFEAQTIERLATLIRD